MSDKLEQFHRLTFIVEKLSKSNNNIKIDELTILIEDTFWKHKVSKEEMIYEINWIFKSKLKSEIEKYLLRCEKPFTKEEITTLFFLRYDKKNRDFLPLIDSAVEEAFELLYNEQKLKVYLDSYKISSKSK